MPNQEIDTEQVDVDTQVPFQEDPPMKKLYNGLVKEQLYTKSFEEFQKQFSTPEAIQKLHNGLASQQLYTKGADEFQQQYFSSVKKKEPSPLNYLDGKSPSPSDNQIPIVDLASKHKFLSGALDVADENAPDTTQPAKKTSFFQGLTNTLQKGKQEMDRQNDPVVKNKNAQDFIKKDLGEAGINVDVNKEMNNPQLAPELGVYYTNRNKELEGQLTGLKDQAQLMMYSQGVESLNTPQFQQIKNKIEKLGTKKQQLQQHVSFLLGQTLSKNTDATPKEIGKTIREVVQPDNKTIREQMFGDKLLTKEQIENRDFNDEFNGISAQQDAVINDYKSGKIDEATAHKKMNDLSNQFNTIEKRYPTVAVDALRNIIGDRIAEFRKNKHLGMGGIQDRVSGLEEIWHNVVSSEPGSAEIKTAIDELKKSGVEISQEQEKQIYESKEKIPLTSALGNFYHNFILNPANKLSNIFQS